MTTTTKTIQTVKVLREVNPLMTIGKKLLYHEGNYNGIAFTQMYLLEGHDKPEMISHIVKGHELNTPNYYERELVESQLNVWFAAL